MDTVAITGPRLFKDPRYGIFRNISKPQLGLETHREYEIKMINF
jgi:hypothetical protein